MKTIKFTMFLLYKYYSKGSTANIPYFSALCVMVLLLYIHIIQFLIIFNAVHLLPMQHGDSRVMKYWKFALFAAPFFLILYTLVKPKDIKSAVYSNEKIKRGSGIFIFYFLINVIALFALMLLFAAPQRR